jgi:hypothetical protein
MRQQVVADYPERNHASSGDGPRGVTPLQCLG